ncbi:hypothetical protein HHI36_010232, partial [Cryptolaemus montrouzieri]
MAAPDSMLGATDSRQEKATGNHLSVQISQDIAMERKPNTTVPSLGQHFNEQGVRRISRLNIAESKLRISTWNIRSLYAARKFDNVIKETLRLTVGVMQISELHWPNSAKCQNEHGTLYYS